MNKYLVKDTEHVFEVQRYDSISERTEPIWLPAFRCVIDGEETLIYMARSVWDQGVWMTTPKLVRIDDIAHLLSPVQQADMRRP